MSVSLLSSVVCLGPDVQLNEVCRIVARVRLDSPLFYKSGSDRGRFHPGSLDNSTIITATATARRPDRQNPTSYWTAACTPRDDGPDSYCAGASVVFDAAAGKEEGGRRCVWTGKPLGNPHPTFVPRHENPHRCYVQKVSDRLHVLEEGRVWMCSGHVSSTHTSCVHFRVFQQRRHGN